MYIIEGTPPLHPGTCLLCKSAGGDGRKFIDFNRVARMIGRIYLCDFCITEVTSILGWVSPANWELAQAEHEETLKELEEVKEQNAKLTNLASSSLDQLLSDLSPLFEAKSANSGTAKRGPGRPKRTESTAS